MIKLLMISVLIVLIGLYCFKSDIHTVRMVGVLELILGAVTLFVALKSLLDKNPQVVMDESGIMDNRILKNSIAWHQIQKMELTVVNNQKVLKLNVSDKFKNENFKWLFAKTAAVRLNQNPKTVLLNLDQLKINYSTLNGYLASRDSDFIPNDVNKNLTGLEKFLNKLLY
ncbi:STM3941 family protein [Flavobacterium limnosediminis]|uniref:STM3941 family protein n=1 Tax=Flavobacterium limnosediminis TaxID=1401027 RepID=UPI0012DDB541|nr:STM3941 family protein [Flavobacterium limnosediminis]